MELCTDRATIAMNSGDFTPNDANTAWCLSRDLFLTMRLIYIQRFFADIPANDDPIQKITSW